MAACLYGALNASGSLKTVEEVIQKVVKDKMFFKNSGGGLTISGGEPLSQSEYVTELFKAAKAEGLHTALDTTGYAEWSRMEKVLEYVDLVLFDVKHTDPEAHKKATGVDNTLILENLEKAAKVTDVWIRIPLIAGYNDSEEIIRKIAELAEKCGIKKISLLPYHEGGITKAQQIGMEYLIPDAKAPDDSHLRCLAEICKAHGITVVEGS